MDVQVVDSRDITVPLVNMVERHTCHSVLSPCCQTDTV
jgi:hypothetical protein